MTLIIHWIIVMVAIIITAYILPGVAVSGFLSAFLTAVVLGFVNAFIRPAALFLTLPINVLTLGLFTFVVNAFLVLLVSGVVPGFKVDGFGSALIGSILLSLISTLLHTLVRS